MPEAPLETDGLVRHPRPHPTESLFGYILRLTEENGYPTPFSILSLIGNGNHQLKTRCLPLQSSPIVSVDCCSLGFLVADRQLA